MNGRPASVRARRDGYSVYNVIRGNAQPGATIRRAGVEVISAEHGRQLGDAHARQRRFDELRDGEFADALSAIHKTTRTR